MNMALDEALLAGAVDTAVLRIYQWSPATLSLGYFQRAADREQHEASRECDLVRRPSGGGAILHDRELTYCLVLPASVAVTQPHMHWYYSVHRALIEALRRVGIVHQIAAQKLDAQMLSDAHSTDTSASEPFLCFQRRAIGDVLLGEHKIAGSAQRRRGGAILQHGSVLLARSPHAPELPGLSDLLEFPIDFAALAEAFAQETAAALAFQLQHDELTQRETLAAHALHDSRYTTAAWTARR
jgi:lipoate-protein ligase A